MAGSEECSPNAYVYKRQNL